MHLFDTVVALQLPPHLLDEVRRLAVGRVFQMQPQRRGLGGIGLVRGDLLVLQHLVQHQVAPLQRAFRKRTGE
jgi:hypothetical protein